MFEGRGLSWKKRKKGANLPGEKARSPEQLWIPGSAPARLGTGAGTVRCPCQGCWLWGDLGSQLFWGSVITKTPKEAQQGSDDKWNNEQPWLGVVVGWKSRLHLWSFPQQSPSGVTIYYILGRAGTEDKFPLLRP